MAHHRPRPPRTPRPVERMRTTGSGCGRRRGASPGRPGCRRRGPPARPAAWTRRCGTGVLPSRPSFESPAHGFNSFRFDRPARGPTPQVGSGPGGKTTTRACDGFRVPVGRSLSPGFGPPLAGFLARLRDRAPRGQGRAPGSRKAKRPAGWRGVACPSNLERRVPGPIRRSAAAASCWLSGRDRAGWIPARWRRRGPGPGHCRPSTACRTAVPRRAAS